MAARLGEDGNRQALAHFVTASPWDPAYVRARLAWKMEAAIRPRALIFDDAGFLKDGKASACVSRQYTGTAGKVTNYQVGVSLHLTSDQAAAAWGVFAVVTGRLVSGSTAEGQLKWFWFNELTLRRAWKAGNG